MLLHVISFASGHRVVEVGHEHGPTPPFCPRTHFTSQAFELLPNFRAPFLFIPSYTDSARERVKRFFDRKAFCSLNDRNRSETNSGHRRRTSVR